LTSDQEAEKLDYLNELMEATVMKDPVDGEDGELYLPLTHIFHDSNKLDLIFNRNVPGKNNRLVVRQFYKQFCTEIIGKVGQKKVKTIFVTGTPGTGKSTLRNYLAWLILQDFKVRKEAVRVGIHKGGIDEVIILCLESDGQTRVELSTASSFRHGVPRGFTLGQNFYVLSDVSDGKRDFCDCFLGGLVVFSSPSNGAFGQLSKQDAIFFFMPLWEKEELCRFDPNGKFEERFVKFGGVPRVVWGDDDDVKLHDEKFLENELDFLSLNGRAVSWLSVSHRFMHLIVPKDSDGNYLWCDYPKLELASRYVARLVADQYVTKMMHSMETQFGVQHASVYGLLFEAVVFNIIEKYNSSCEFPIQLIFRKVEKKAKAKSSKTKSLNAVARKEESNQFPLIDENNCLFQVPVGMKVKEFDTDKFQAAIERGCVLAVPRSDYFAGFDGAITFEQKKCKYLALIQVTTAKSHPLSRAGLSILADCYNSGVFKKIVIVFITPPSAKPFPSQRIKPMPREANEGEAKKKKSRTKSNDKIDFEEQCFEETDQYQMTIKFGADKKATRAAAVN
jgi:energy-coupling factor transporter ATP-binding protein EcfA2